MTDTTFGTLSPADLGLFVDRYELTMLEGYLAADHAPQATFALFFRDLPPDRGYVVAAGLAQAVEYLETLSFDADALASLEDLGYAPETLSYLESFSFSGDVRALPEGTVAFPEEPLLEVTAPLPEAQLFETLLLNQVGYQSLIATKAARMRDAVDRHGDDQSLVDFGSRRAHGTDAGMKAARAAAIGGFDATSNVAAARAFDLPAVGTMAHSWVQSFPTERAAFEAFVDAAGEDAVLLIDTYDTVGGARTALAVAADLDVDVAGVRLDSGDLVALSKRVAGLADDAGVDFDVVVSSGMDEYAIERFLTAGGVATGFGPGTALTTGGDVPSLDAVYKLVAVERDGELAPSMKLSAGKVSHPGRKRVRRVRRDGGFERDVLARRDEDAPGEDLLVPVFEDGRRVSDPPSLQALRARRREQVRALPAGCRALRNPEEYEVTVSDGLRSVTESLRDDLIGQYVDGE
ncbi:MAG: nicotinate phosphoribosyltransferase [Haloarculaceae archaeon]